VRRSFGRGRIVSSARVQLEAPAAFAAFRSAIAQARDLGLVALREDQYGERQTQGTEAF
jgi:hypothetical protein